MSPSSPHTPWNKGKIVGRKPPLTPEYVQVIRTLLSQRGIVRDMAMFSLAIDSSLRGKDIVGLNVSDVVAGDQIKQRVTIMQSKTRERVTFSLTDYTREALKEWIKESDKTLLDPLFSSTRGPSKGKRLSMIRYHQMVKEWLELAHLDSSRYGTHSLRRTRVAHIYQHTGNIKAVQVLLGHKSIENTARYLGIEEEQALNIAEKFKI